MELSLQAKLQLKAAGWRPPLLVAQARSRAKVMLLAEQRARLLLLEPQD